MGRILPSMMQNQAIPYTASERRTPGMIHALLTGVSLISLHVAKVVRQTVEKRRQRRALSKLDDRLLRDVGLTRSEATREAQRLF